ncbi:MAG: hypothetical protein GF344_10225 [Chitinivibrionales bacterium]|nr:hypothetical protein [Chitinivibrionales bacterium]
MKSLTYLSIPLMVLITALIGCDGTGRLEELFKEPNTNPVRKVLKITMPLGYAANLAMTAMTGEKPANVHFVEGGEGTLGNFVLKVTVDEGFPLPLGIEATGHILVAGVMARQSMAMMSMVFTEINITQGVFAINDISTVPVVMEEDLVTGDTELFVVFADMDMNGGSDTLFSVGMTDERIEAEMERYQKMKLFDEETTIEQNTWIIRIDNGETPTEPSDDIYAVSGGGQYVDVGSSSADITQITMMNTRMKPTCKKNPLEGWTLLQNIDGGDVQNEIGHLLLDAHDVCDGSMKVGAATGVYSRMWGKRIAMNLDQ